MKGGMYMPKIYEFTQKDKTGKIKNVGKMEIKNKTASSADICFYGDIVSTAYDPDDWWGGGSKEDKAPQDVADFLNELDGMTDVNIHVNSGGGDVFAGLAIYNILKNNNANKTTYVEGLAASAASIIALAGDTVIIPSSAQFMIHNPSTFAMGNANDFRQMADLLDQIAQSLINVYMDNAKEGVTEDQIKQMMDDETWMTGDQAAECFNIQVDKADPVAACANSDYFNNYKHLPKNLDKKEPEPPKNNNEEILKTLGEINNRLNKLEKPPIEEPNPQDDLKTKQLKAKLALECQL
jgi:ATP-dependent Clp protease, protease subunit